MVKRRGMSERETKRTRVREKRTGMRDRARGNLLKRIRNEREGTTDDI